MAKRGALCDSPDRLRTGAGRAGRRAGKRARRRKPRAHGSRANWERGTTAPCVICESIGACSGEVAMADHILVIGAGGFVGQPAGRDLAARGERLIAVGRKAFPASGAGVETIVVAGRDPQDYLPLLRRSRVVVHLASASTPGSSAAQPLLEVDENLRPTLALLQALQEYPALPLAVRFLRRDPVRSEGGRRRRRVRDGRAAFLPRRGQDRRGVFHRGLVQAVPRIRASFCGRPIFTGPGRRSVPASASSCGVRKNPARRNPARLGRRLGGARLSVYRRLHPLVHRA